MLRKIGVVRVRCDTINTIMNKKRIEWLVARCLSRSRNKVDVDKKSASFVSDVIQCTHVEYCFIGICIRNSPEVILLYLQKRTDKCLLLILVKSLFSNVYCICIQYLYKLIKLNGKRRFVESKLFYCKRKTDNEYNDTYIRNTHTTTTTSVTIKFSVPCKSEFSWISSVPSNARMRILVLHAWVGTID